MIDRSIDLMRHLGQEEVKLPWRDQSGDQGGISHVYPCN